jgi:hypothetical protein
MLLLIDACGLRSLDESMMMGGSEEHMPRDRDCRKASRTSNGNTYTTKRPGELIVSFHVVSVVC